MAPERAVGLKTTNLFRNYLGRETVCFVRHLEIVLFFFCDFKRRVSPRVSNDSKQMFPQQGGVESFFSVQSQYINGPFENGAQLLTLPNAGIFYEMGQR